MVEILIAGALALALAVSALVRLSLTIHHWRVGKLRSYRTAFFEAADRLLASEDGLNDERLTRLRGMTSDIDSATAFRNLLKVLMETEAELRSGKSRESLPPEWAALLHNYFLAVVYSGLFRGLLLLPMLTAVFDPVAGSQNAEFIDRRIHSPRLQAV
jgi:hypothetical protein